MAKRDDVIIVEETASVGGKPMTFWHLYLCERGGRSPVWLRLNGITLDVWSNSPRNQAEADLIAERVRSDAALREWWRNRRWRSYVKGNPASAVGAGT